MKTKVICCTLLVEKSPQALPLGAACIASAIKNDRRTKDLCDVQLVSYTVEDSDFIKANVSTDAAGIFIGEKLWQLVCNAKDSAPVICFSVFVWNRPVLEEAAKFLKQKGCITIAGGPEITARPDAYKSFDFTIAGEGELKVPALLEKIITGQNKNLQVSDTENATDNLARLSSPYLDGTLDPAEFGGALWELARGCPFKCSYCYESKGEKTVRLFPMERIEKELDLFAKKKLPQVFVLDPTYNANKQRALDLLKLIAKKTPDTFYYFEARAEFIDRQLAQAFTRLPCAVQIGLQTANEEVAKAVHRPFVKKQFLKGINCLNEADVIFGLDLIYGLPLDTFKSFKESVDFAASLYPNNLEIFCLSVLPGTDLYDRAQELKLNFQETPPYHVIHTDRFSAQDLEAARKIAEGCSLFYNSGRAVPWFNTICKAAKIRPSQFFMDFSQWNDKQAEKIDCSCTDHLLIEKIQLKFINHLFNNKNLGRYLKAANDIIVYNGAISRKTDTGKTQFITLNYPVEYVASEYSLDLDFFIHNLKMKPGKVRI